MVSDEDRRRDVEDEAIAGLSWDTWPQGLTDRARYVVDELQAGRPVQALSGLDELIGDLAARRRTVAEIANRRFEPSTDDRRE